MGGSRREIERVIYVGLEGETLEREGVGVRCRERPKIVRDRESYLARVGGRNLRDLRERGVGETKGGRDLRGRERERVPPSLNLRSLYPSIPITLYVSLFEVSPSYPTYITLCHSPLSPPSSIPPTLPR